MKYMSKMWALVLLVVVMCCGLMIGCGNGKDSGKESNKNTLFLKDYIRVESTGYSGYADVALYLDKQKMAEDYKKEFEKLQEYSQTCESDILHLCGFLPNVQGEGGELYCEESFEYGWKYSNVKNGDVVQLKWSVMYPDYTVEDLIGELEKGLGIKVVADAFEYEFKDITELKVVDPFEYYYIWTYKDADGNDHVKDATIFIETGDGLWKKAEVSRGINIDCRGEIVSNGDKVKLSIADDIDMEEMERERGVRFSRTEAEVEVYGLNEYGKSTASEGKKQTVDLADYAMFVVDGEHSGYATLYKSINWIKLMIDYKDSIRTNLAPEETKYSNPAFAELYRILDDECMLDDIFGKHGEYTEQIDGIKNGDVYNYTFNNKEIGALITKTNITKLYNIEFVQSQSEYKVEGLKEVEK